LRTDARVYGRSRTEPLEPGERDHVAVVGDEQTGGAGVLDQPATVVVPSVKAQVAPPPDPVPEPAPAPAPSVTVQPGTATPPGSVVVTPGSPQVAVPPTTIQADSIRANQVRAQTIYANKITARDVQGIIHQSDNVKFGGGKNDVKAPLVTASVIYADDIKADSVVANEIYVRNLKRD